MVRAYAKARLTVCHVYGKRIDFTLQSRFIEFHLFQFILVIVYFRIDFRGIDLQTYFLFYLGGKVFVLHQLFDKLYYERLRRKSVEAEFITMENIYKILEHFNELYDIISDEEKKELISTSFALDDSEGHIRPPFRNIQAYMRLNASNISGSALPTSRRVSSAETYRTCATA